MFNQPPQFVNFPTPAPHAHASPHSRLTFDEVIQKGYAKSDTKVRHAISRSTFPSPDAMQQCSSLIKYLRIYKHLFMHTYVHLASCRSGAHLHRLVEYADRWKAWGSVKQLINQSTIRDAIVRFWAGHQCGQHGRLISQRFVIAEDEDDFLYLLLYCGKKEELFNLEDQDSRQAIELYWQFLTKSNDIDVLRRLRADVYRMARKCQYLPRDLQIGFDSVSNTRQLTGGAHGRVTKATMNCRGSVRDVVIKTIVCNDAAAQTKCIKTFSSEAIIWASLQHKNIVPFLGVISEGLNMGLVSPFFKNGNIKVRLQRYNARDWPPLAVKWGRDIANGLEYIHSHEPPIIHGDLKSDNVLIDDHEHACIGDFGQSHSSDSGKFLDSSRVGLIYTPVHWMAPEGFAGNSSKASDKSDMYSFGCVLYEMVSGKVPFEGHSTGDVMARVNRGERPSKPESIHSGDRLWELAMSCWNHYPQDRPSAAYAASILR